jgi:hypothetical protein
VKFYKFRAKPNNQINKKTGKYRNVCRLIYRMFTE